MKTFTQTYNATAENNANLIVANAKRHLVALANKSENFHIIYGTSSVKSISIGSKRGDIYVYIGQCCHSIRCVLELDNKAIIRRAPQTEDDLKTIIDFMDCVLRSKS